MAKKRSSIMTSSNSMESVNTSPEIDIIPRNEFDAEFEQGYYDKCKADGLDLSFYGKWQDAYACFIDTFFKIKNKTILDIGCAMGAIAKGFVQYHCNVIGVDISKYMIDNSPFKNEIRLINTNASDLSKIEDNSVDLIHSMQMFHLINDEKTILSSFLEMKRVAKNDAMVCIICEKNADVVRLKEISQKVGMIDESEKHYNLFKRFEVTGWKFMDKYDWKVMVFKVQK